MQWLKVNLFTNFLVCIFGIARAQVAASNKEPYLVHCSSFSVPPNYDFTWTCMKAPCKDRSGPQKRATNTNNSYFCNPSDPSTVCCLESPEKLNQTNKGKPTTFEPRPVVVIPGDRNKKKPDKNNVPPSTPFPSTTATPVTFTEAVDPLVQKLQAKRFSKFDRDLLFELSKSDENRGKNIIVSPASIKSLLALLVEGSSGETMNEILHALQLNTTDRQESLSLLRKSYSLLKNNATVITLESGNRIYRANNVAIKKEYESTVERLYDVDIEPLDFSKTKEAAKIINKWVNEVTRGLIPTLVEADKIEKDTKLFLLNYMYLKANWDLKFDLQSTHTRCFYERENECQKVRYMHTKRPTNYTDSEEFRAEIFEIPFRDPRYRIVFILPHAGVDVQSVLESLDRKDLFELFKNFEEEDINLSMPRTTVEYSSGMVETLKKLNIKTIFGNEAKLDHLLKNNTPLFLCSVIHKARIEFTEEGAEAAAVSGGGTMTLSADTDRNVVADRPFLFFIRDTTVAGFLFEGIVSSPDRANKQQL